MGVSNDSGIAVLNYLKQRKGQKVTWREICNYTGLKKSIVYNCLRTIRGNEMYLLAMETDAKGRFITIKFIRDLGNRKADKVYNPALWPIPPSLILKSKEPKPKQ
jgi:hypothetical protein